MSKHREELLLFSYAHTFLQLKKYFKMKNIFAIIDSLCDTLYHVQDVVHMQFSHSKGQSVFCFLSV